MTAAEELSTLFEALPADKAKAALDFTRYLAERADDEAWERSMASAQTSPRFKRRLAEVEREIAAGQAQPLDANHL